MIMPFFRLTIRPIDSNLEELYLKRYSNIEEKHIKILTKIKLTCSFTINLSHIFPILKNKDR